MSKLDDDNNTNYSFFETTQIILDLASAENMLPNFVNSFNVIEQSQSALFYPSLMFCWADDHVIFIW